MQANRPVWHVVIWDDAQRLAGEIEPAEVQHRPYRWTTGGWLIRTDESGTSLAAEVGEDGKVRGADFIPRTMIVEEWTVGPAKKPRLPRVRKPAIP